MEGEENQSILNRRESRDCCIRCCSSCCVGCVCSKGILLLLTWSVLLHSFGYYLYFQFLSVNPAFVYLFIAVSVVQAVVFLLYPVAGLMGEVCFSRYKLMIAGTILALIGIVITVSTATVGLLKSGECFVTAKCSVDYSLLGPACIGLVIYQFGLGLFEANAIQFGTDQLQFASNDKLSVFVNWYFWALYTTNIVHPFIIIFGLLVPAALDRENYAYFTTATVLGVTCISFISIFIILLCCCGCHSHFTTEPVGRINPVKHIFKVLNYARHHSQPVFRSAFTYGEVPSRLDLAKNRYGGPFTTEEVEDVKTFGRILLVLISLFGFLLLPNSVTSFAVYSEYTFFLDIQQAILYFFLSYVNIQYILPVLLIPVHMLIIRPCFNRYTYRISILNKMGVGLILVVMSSGLMTAVDVSLHNFVESVNLSSYENISRYSTFNESVSPPNYIPSVIIVSQFLNGLSLILVFLSALEFILAQGPRSMQGLLIGLWYAYQSVYVLVVVPSLLLRSYQNFHYWLTVLNTCLAVLSLIVFIIISRWYKYRQREESSEINRQAIIEEYTERQLIAVTNIEYDDEHTSLSDYSVHSVIN